MPGRQLLAQRSDQRARRALRDHGRAARRGPGCGHHPLSTLLGIRRTRRRPAGTPRAHGAPAVARSVRADAVRRRHRRPLERMLGIATVTLHTAAAASDARIPGLAGAEAARLRDRLAALGEARTEGL